MTLLTSAIISACMGVHGNYNAACNKAIQAEMNQSGVEQVEGNAEKKSMAMANKTAKENAGEIGTAVLATSVFAIKSYTEKKVSFTIKDPGMCDSITPEFKKDSGVIKFNWGW